MPEHSIATGLLYTLCFLVSISLCSVFEEWFYTMKRDFCLHIYNIIVNKSLLVELYALRYMMWLLFYYDLTCRTVGVAYYVHTCAWGVYPVSA